MDAPHDEYPAVSLEPRSSGSTTDTDSTLPGLRERRLSASAELAVVGAPSGWHVRHSGFSGPLAPAEELGRDALMAGLDMDFATVVVYLGVAVRTGVITGRRVAAWAWWVNPAWWGCGQQDGAVGGPAHTPLRALATALDEALDDVALHAAAVRANNDDDDDGDTPLRVRVVCTDRRFAALLAGSLGPLLALEALLHRVSQPSSDSSDDEEEARGGGCFRALARVYRRVQANTHPRGLRLDVRYVLVAAAGGANAEAEGVAARFVDGMVLGGEEGIIL